MPDAYDPEGGAACIAVLMACHNRRDKTLNALHSLEQQRGLPPGTSVRVHLVDAGSTDGTVTAVVENFPHVDVATVGPDVFWGEGMRIASHRSSSAALPRWDYQLWLNDDVRLADDALATLLSTARDVGGDAVVAGAVHSLDGRRTTYSGRRLRGPSRWHPHAHELLPVAPTGRTEPCDTYNGNVVLLPCSVLRRIGGIDRRFPHRMGDYDHGFRARRAGIAAYVAPRHVGACDANPPLRGSREPGIGVREALRRAASRRELPCRAWWVYCARHLWPWAPLLMCSPYTKAVVRALADRARTRRR